MLDAHVDRDDVGGDSFMRFGLTVMDDPKSWIRWRTGGIREF
jgi:hypothetical protein